MSNSKRWREFIKWWDEYKKHHSVRSMEEIRLIMRIDDKIKEIKKGEKEVK